MGSDDYTCVEIYITYNNMKNKGGITLADKKLKHEPTYSSGISSMRQFIILFCIGIGVVGLLIYVPIVLFCMYMLALAEPIIIYILAVVGLHIFTGLGLYLFRVCVRVVRALV